MGNVLKIIGGLIMAFSVLFHVLGYMGTVFAENRLEAVHTGLVDGWNPQNEFLDSPNLSTSDKQQLVLAVRDRKEQVLSDLQLRRQSQFAADRQELQNLMIGGIVIGAVMFKVGQLLQGKVPVVPQEPPAETPVTDSLLESDRKGNPFKKGAVSDIVLPRGELWKKRNKFRKTVERPNSDGY